MIDIIISGSSSGSGSNNITLATSVTAELVSSGPARTMSWQFNHLLGPQSLVGTSISAAPLQGQQHQISSSAKAMATSQNQRQADINNQQQQAQQFGLIISTSPPQQQLQPAESKLLTTSNNDYINNNCGETNSAQRQHELSSQLEQCDSYLQSFFINQQQQQQQQPGATASSNKCNDKNQMSYGQQAVGLLASQPDTENGGKPSDMFGCFDYLQQQQQQQPPRALQNYALGFVMGQHKPSQLDHLSALSSLSLSSAFTTGPLNPIGVSGQASGPTITDMAAGCNNSNRAQDQQASGPIGSQRPKFARPATSSSYYRAFDNFREPDSADSTCSEPTDGNNPIGSLFEPAKVRRQDTSKPATELYRSPSGAIDHNNNNNNIINGNGGIKCQDRSVTIVGAKRKNKLPVLANSPGKTAGHQSTQSGKTSASSGAGASQQQQPQPQHQAQGQQVYVDMHGSIVFNSDGSERYSRKVFAGGLPPDIDEDEITATFRCFGSLSVDWPHKAESKSYFPPKGYAFLLFHEEQSVQNLIDACFQESDKLYLYVSSPSTTDKLVQIRPWRLIDADYVMDATLALDPRKTVFVGGVPRPLKAFELANIMSNLYGGVCYAGIDTDPDLKYPKGAGRVAFSNHESYLSAISARFVQLQHNEFEKRVEVKPYVLDDQNCDECNGTRCQRKFAPFFCANINCLQYYCENCWPIVHSAAGKELHKPLVKEGTDRPRALPPMRWY